MKLTEKQVQERLKHTKVKTFADGKRCIVFFPCALPLKNPHKNVRVIIADCSSWQAAYDAVKDRNDLGRASSVTFAPQNSRYKTPDCADAHRIADYLKLHEDVEAEVVEHDDVYYVVPKEEAGLFSQ